MAQPVAQTSTHARVRTLHSADVFFGQNIVPVVDAVGRKVSVGDEVMATPRRPRGLLSRGLRGVDYGDQTAPSRGFRGHVAETASCTKGDAHYKGAVEMHTLES